MVWVLLVIWAPWLPISNTRVSRSLKNWTSFTIRMVSTILLIRTICATNRLRLNVFSNGSGIFSRGKTRLVSFGFYFCVKSLFHFSRCENTHILYHFQYPKSVKNGKFPIASVRDLTTGIDTSQPDGQTLLPSSKSSEMITFSFENGAVITLRTSGTEPKIKYYAEMCAKPEEKYVAWMAGKTIYRLTLCFYLYMYKFCCYRNWDELRATLRELIDATVLELLEPEKNKIIPQSDWNGWTSIVLGEEIPKKNIQISINVKHFGTTSWHID